MPCEDYALLATLLRLETIDRVIGRMYTVHLRASMCLELGFIGNAEAWFAQGLRQPTG